MNADLDSFDRLCDERFDGSVEELRDFCTIPCETDQFAELDRGAQWVEQRLRLRIHAPNESYSLDLMRRAAKVTGRFVREFAAIES